MTNPIDIIRELAPLVFEPYGFFNLEIDEESFKEAEEYLNKEISEDEK